MGTKTFDKKCYELSMAFLDDEQWFREKPLAERERFVDDLAGEIQQVIESQINYYRESLHVEI